MAIGNAFTQRLLRDAGLGPGMRVLDVGCGTGEVTFLAAALVGPLGAVVGLDRENAPLAAGRAKAQAQGLATVTFTQGDIDAVSADLGQFDAIIGRRVLMYQADAVNTVRSLADALKPGGLMVFHEHDATMTPASLAPMPLHHRVQGWLHRMIEREGADLHMGFNLHGVFTRAGLAVEEVRAEAIVQTPEAPYALGEIVRAVMPRIVAQGVATADEIAIDTLQQRLDAERKATNATYIGDMMFGIWGRKTGSAVIPPKPSS